MNRFYLSHASFVIVGAVFALDAITTFTAEGLGVSVILGVLGGGLIVLGSIGSVLTTKPADFTNERYLVWPAILGALLYLLGIALQLMN